METLFAAVANPERYPSWLFIGLLSLAVLITAGRRMPRRAHAAVPGHRRGHVLLALVLVAGLAIAGPVGLIAGGGTAAAQSQTAAMDAVAVVKQVGPGVVTIVSTNIKGHGPLPDTKEVAAGSGFFIDRQGHIVTNNHVVTGGDEFQVVFADGTAQTATLVGTDPITDLAVLQVAGPAPAVLTLGDSDALQVGQPVLAIGSALGTFTNTVTEGIVSALGRSLAEDPNNPGLHLSGLIQHDAAINPGNSGGPLVDAAGQVIGVNTLAVTQAEPGVSAQGLFFAIPVNTVKKISAELIATGQVVYPYLGIGDSVELTPGMANFFGLGADHGVYVGKVEKGGPADKAGIKADDIIVAIDGTELGEETSLTDVLFTHKPGDVVQVDVVRGNDRLTVAVTLGTRPSS
jgi:2-alkenal reductase